MIDYLRALAIFAKVAEVQSFRGAARALSLSPSVVSQQIAALERRLGAALIYRSTRSLTLTPDGEALLASAQAMVEEAEAGLGRFSGVAPKPVGKLHVTLPEVMSVSPLTDRLAAFSNAHPGVALRATYSDTQLDPIRHGYDLAIRVGWLKDSALKAKKLGDVPRMLVASAAYVAERGQPQHPDDLRGWNLVSFEAVAGATFLRRGTEAPVEMRLSSRLSASTGLSAYRFARAGAGVAVVLDFLAQEDLEAGKMVHLLPGWSLEPAGVYAVWPPNVPRKGLTMRLLRFVEGAVSEAGAAAPGRDALVLAGASGDAIGPPSRRGSAH